MDPSLFLEKCKQENWEKVNEMKTPRILADVANSKNIKSKYRTAQAFFLASFFAANRL